MTKWSLLCKCILANLGHLVFKIFEGEYGSSDGVLVLVFTYQNITWILV